MKSVSGAFTTSISLSPCLLLRAFVLPLSLSEAPSVGSYPSCPFKGRPLTPQRKDLPAE